MYFFNNYDDTIKNISEKLNTSYSNLLGRFSVLDNLGDDSSPSQQNSLEVLIARVNKEIIQCTTDKESERDALSLLTTELRVFIEDSVPEMKHATLFLLGGLIHRFYRIEIQYRNYNESSFNPFSYFQKTLWNVNDCRLYIAIKNALQLDKRPLDEVTIVTSLTVFQQNMLKTVSIKEAKSDKVIEDKKYKTYPHLSTDANFERNLDSLIKEHSKKGAYELQQFRAIYFMETLAMRLEESRILLEKEISEWSQSLSKAHKEFKQLNEDLVLNHLNNYIKGKIDSLPNKANIKDKKEVTTIENKTLLLESIKEQTLALLFNVELDTLEGYPKLIAQMFQDNINRNRCLLCGGYSLLAHNGDKVDERLLGQMKTALGLDGELNAEEELVCIQRLLLYVNKVPSPILNCEFFNGRGNMVTAVTQLASNLELAKKQRESKAKAVENKEKDPYSPIILSLV